jgi:hypothetical protein
MSSSSSGTADFAAGPYRAPGICNRYSNGSYYVVPFDVVLKDSSTLRSYSPFVIQIPPKALDGKLNSQFTATVKYGSLVVGVATLTRVR